MAKSKYVETINSMETKITTKDMFLKNCYAILLNKDNIPYQTDLSKIPHKLYLDLAIVYSIQIKSYKKNELCVECHVITNEDLESFQITMEELLSAIDKNVNLKNNPKIIEFSESILNEKNILSPLVRIPKGMNGMISRDIPDGMDKGPLSKIPIFCNGEGKKDILVLTNRYQSYSAIHMINDEVIEKVKNQFNNESFYFIPMSIHQILCIRRSFVTNNNQKDVLEAENDLIDMVEGVNDSINHDTNILSYHIYFYDVQDCCTLRI